MNRSKKKVIQIAAAKLFRDRGYAATSMRDLAEAVHLKASSLYNHISGKEEILKDICFETSQRFLEALEEVEKKDISYSEKIRHLIQLHIQTAMTDVTSITAFNDEWRHLSEPHLSTFKTIRKEYENRFRDIIQQGMDNHQIRNGDPTIILYTILSSVRWLYDWYRPDRVLTSSELEDSIINILMSGIAK
ncbi:MAG: TetR/AcrR family transcriptional regulator [Bacteroidetes bacterium]|nr:MAG: TetR/AcrR family transcriptional regulator [Bacteroidota bacterium]